MKSLFYIPIFFFSIILIVFGGWGLFELITFDGYSPSEIAMNGILPIEFGFTIFERFGIAYQGKISNDLIHERYFYTFFSALCLSGLLAILIILKFFIYNRK